MSDSNQKLDSETIKLIVQVAVPLLDELVKRVVESQSKIQQLLEKFDQLILREINSGFDALRDASLTDSEETKMRRLNYAEEQLLRCTGLELNTQIGEYKSAYWVALSHFGLVTIMKLRGDDTLAARHVLKTFVADARTARKTLFPKVYESVFLPKCNEVVDWYNQNLIAIEKNDYSSQIRLAKWLTAGKAGAKYLGGIWMMTQPNTKMAGQETIRQTMESSRKELNDLSPEKFRAEAREKLRAEYEIKLDLKCKEIAQNSLA